MSSCCSDVTHTIALSHTLLLSLTHTHTSPCMGIFLSLYLSTSIHTSSLLNIYHENQKPAAASHFIFPPPHQHRTQAETSQKSPQVLDKVNGHISKTWISHHFKKSHNSHKMGVTHLLITILFTTTVVITQSLNLRKPDSFKK